MDTTSWLVTAAGLAAMAWVVWFFWLSERPRSTAYTSDNLNGETSQAATPAKNEVIDVEGMSCGHCVEAVDEALAELDGVEDYDVAIGSVEVTYNPDRISRETIEAAIQQAGYEVASPA